MFESVDAALLRMTTLTTSGYELGWPDLTDDPTGPAERAREWRQWLQQVWTIEEFASAVEVASPSLARDVRRVCDGEHMPARNIRPAVVSVVKYLLRAMSRATPFGLFAGVAPVRVGPATAVEVGSAHRVVSRVDAEWLDLVITRLEGCPGMRQRLPVVANDLAFIRDGRLVISSQRRAGDPASGGATAAEVSVRFSRAVRVAMHEARSPIRVQDLAVILAGEFPEVAPAVVDTMLSKLVEQRLLVTSLRPPMTMTDPLGHVVEQSARAGAMNAPEAATLFGQLHRIHLALDEHDRVAAPDRRRALRRSTTATMARLGPGERPLGVDLRIDAAVVIPREVAREAEAAATALTCLTPAPAGTSASRDYHRRFLARYGIGAIVPVRDLVDPDTGLGYPAGFRDSLLTVPAAPLDARDIALMCMAQRAAVEHTLEVVLDETTLADLETDGVTAARWQPHTELTCQVHAATRHGLDAGDFLLVVTGVSRAAGTTSGRFLDLLEPADQQRMAAVYSALPATRGAALRAQVSCAPLNPRAENIARSPQVLSHRITLAEHDSADHHSTGPGVIALADLAVTGDVDGLCLISASRLEPVEPLTFNAVELTRSAHPMPRFLYEITTMWSASCMPFSWGAARHLPFLPRVRYRRAVLSPARWRLTTADVADSMESATTWDTNLAQWRRSYHVPDAVEVGEDDRRLHLDLTEPAHRHILRDSLDRKATVTLREAPGPTAFGWLDGRAHELVVPLAHTQAPNWPHPSRRPRSRPIAVEHGHLPGASPWLSATIVTHPDRHPTILTTHLPHLLATWDSEPQWWFLPHHDPEHHLRLRIRLATPEQFGAAAQRVGAWARRLREYGLLGPLRFETYYPETGRFGDGAAMTAAEAVFAADSTAALAQLAANIPREAVIAAGVVDIVTAFIGNADEGLCWCIDHFPRTARPGPARTLREHAISLTRPHDGYAALQARPGGDRIATAWAQRRTALAAYRATLADAGHPHPEAVLPDLLHLHHTRMAGLRTDLETACLHLARTAALSWTTRTREAA